MHGVHFLNKENQRSLKGRQQQDPLEFLPFDQVILFLTGGRKVVDTAVFNSFRHVGKISEAKTNLHVIPVPCVIIQGGAGKENLLFKYSLSTAMPDKKEMESVKEVQSYQLLCVFQFTYNHQIFPRLLIFLISYFQRVKV